MPKNPANAPSEEKIRTAGAIPYASQIPNDSDSDGEYLRDVIQGVGNRTNVKIADLAIDTLNDEQSAPLGGVASNQFAPELAVVHMKAVGGAAAAGNVAITIGIQAGGTEILAAIVLASLINLNDKVVIDLSTALGSPIAKPPIGGDATIFVKVTTADTTAGAGHLADVYLFGILFPGA